MIERFDLCAYLARLADPLWLCQAAVPGERCLMASSFNQKNGPRDCNYFQRDEIEGDTTWHVLVDLEGPGCITRFWTGGRFDGALEIWLDDEPTPRYRTTINAFFGGGLEHFQPPLVLDSPASSEGRVSYMPIPYAKHCVVRAASDTHSFYWQINALSYSSDVQVTTMPKEFGEAEQAALAAIVEHWTQNDVAETLDWQSINCPAGQETTLLTRKEPGRFDLMAFDLGTNVSALHNLLLRIYWDGAKQPAIDVPLADLFYQRTAVAKVNSLFARFGDGQGWFGLPMPFERCRITLYNEGKTDVSLGWAYSLSEPTELGPLRLQVNTTRRRLPYGTVIQLVNAQGHGRLVGLYLTTEQLPPVGSVPYFNQEGNEYLYVDGDKDPSWIGTGTEDYFNCAYYYARGTVSTPTHGCVDLRQGLGGEAKAGLVGAYRWHLLDSVPYDERLLMLLEAGCPKKGAISDVNGQEMLDYAWTTFLYTRTDTANYSSNEEDLTL